MKEAKINTIKCLRKYSSFSKSNFEDILKENFDLKAKIVELTSHCKILTVAIAKLKCKNKKDDSCITSFTESLKKSPSSFQNTLPVGKQKLPNLRKSGASVSTAASEQGDERLIQEIASLKKELVDKEQDFKIQMSRMKMFYDKHLLELNQLKLNKPKIEVKKTAEELNTEEEKRESEVRSLRSKLRDRDSEQQKLQSVIKEKEGKIIELKNRIANQGFTKLSKEIEDLKGESKKKDDTIRQRNETIATIDNLEHQLSSKYPDKADSIKRLVRVYLWASQLVTEDSQMLTKRLALWLIELWNSSVGHQLAKLAKQVWLTVRDRLITVDVTAMVQDEIGRWSSRLAGDRTQSERFFRLQEENESLTAEIKKYKMMVDAIVCTDGNYRSILCRHR